VSSKEVSLTKNKREDLKEGKSKQSDVLTYVKKERRKRERLYWQKNKLYLLKWLSRRDKHISLFFFFYSYYLFNAKREKA